VRTWLSTLERGDEAGYLATVTDDVEVVLPQKADSERGKTATRTYFKALRKQIAELDTSIDNVWGLQGFVIVEYFVIDNLSLGGFVEYAHTSISPAGNGPSTNTDTFGVGPRVGYDFRLSNSFSFWPKAFIAFATTNESSGNQSGSNTSWTLGIFAPFLLHPAEHFFLGLGPLLSTQIANSNSPGGGQPQATVYGLEFELGGWVGL